MEWAELLRDQAGVVSDAQAVAHGFAARTVRRRVADGDWSRPAPGVLLVGGHRLTDEARARASWLWAGPSSLLSGSTAAYWLGYLPRLPAIARLTVPPDTRRTPPPRVRIRRRAVCPRDRVTVRGVPATAGPLTVLETAAEIDDGAAFLDRALQRHVTFVDVHRAYCRSVSAHGMARAGELLVAAADRADSGLVRRLVTALRRGGLSGGLVLAEPFGPWTIDVAYPHLRLAIEVDGWAWHSDTDRFRNDRRKGNALVTAGWTLLRFTWHDITERPAFCVAQVRQALERAA